MIETTIGSSGDVTVRQRLAPPAVYLDHWALGAVAGDAVLGARLTEVLKARGGTLALSWANIAEFLNVDAESASRAERFIEAQCLRLFFLESDPFEVIKRESSLLAGEGSGAPHADLELLRWFASPRASIGQRFSFLGVFTGVSGARRRSRESLKASFVERVNSLRAEYLKDPKLRDLAGSKAGVLSHGVWRRSLGRSVVGMQRPEQTNVTLQEVLDLGARQRSAQ